MKKLILLTMVLGLLVSGCGLLEPRRRQVFFSPKGSWVKERVSLKELNEDYRECRGEGSPIQTRSRDNEGYIDRCMESKGYIWKEEK